MNDIVERLRKRQMMQDVRGTGDRFVKQIAVPDALCQLAADEIERLTGVVSQVNSRCDHLGMRLGEVIRERDKLRSEVERLREALRLAADEPNIDKSRRIADAILYPQP